jgi:hypothetical protein
MLVPLSVASFHREAQRLSSVTDLEHADALDGC